MTRFSADEPPPSTDCPQCAAYYAAYQRASLLLERLAEDRFPDQQAFEEWIERQVTLVFRNAKRPARVRPKE